MKLFIVFFFYSFSIFAQQKTRVLFILDASNSMNLDWENQTRLGAAKSILSNALEEYREVPDLEIALRVYGHQTPVTSSFQDCSDTRLEVGFGPSNIDAIQKKITTIQAKGATPIARSLEAAAGDFPDTLQRNFIILITDGLESCDNDPCLIARKLKEKGVKVTPFVIGIGMDLSYLNQFNCIGTFVDAENKNSFQSGLTSIINKTLLNTTAQINLNDIQGQAKETNVSCLLYEAGTKNLKYSFLHTLNQKRLPDTLVINPNFKYDILVKTLPEVLVTNVSLQKHTHNIIPIDVPQGFIKLTSTREIPGLNMRVMQKGSSNTLNEQKQNEVQKYLVGEYDIEVFTLPRTYKKVSVNQSKITKVQIASPGDLVLKGDKFFSGQIFIDRGNELDWVCNINERKLEQTVKLQPGKYILIYRDLKKYSTDYSIKKPFNIGSNKTITINL